MMYELGSRDHIREVGSSTFKRAGLRKAVRAEISGPTRVVPTITGRIAEMPRDCRKRVEPVEIYVTNWLKAWLYRGLGLHGLENPNPSLRVNIQAQPPLNNLPPPINLHNTVIRNSPYNRGQRQRDVACIIRNNRVVHVANSVNDAATTFVIAQISADGGLNEFHEAPSFLRPILAADLM
ncbi:hypothetical protein AgCh_032182 [Apium graveolens]